MRARGSLAAGSLALLFAAALLASPLTEARAQDAPRVLPGCGICFPEGYDINTGGRVQGKLLDLEVPDEGPVRFVIAGEAERWVVLASPAWFWKKIEPPLAPGDIVTVHGSKSLGADGGLYLIAREIRPQDSAAVVLLRDPQGAPLWRGGHRGGGGTPAGESGAGSGRKNGRGRDRCR